MEELYDKVVEDRRVSDRVMSLAVVMNYLCGSIMRKNHSSHE